MRLSEVLNPCETRQRVFSEDYCHWSHILPSGQRLFVSEDLDSHDMPIFKVCLVGYHRLFLHVTASKSVTNGGFDRYQLLFQVLNLVRYYGFNGDTDMEAVAV